MYNDKYIKTKINWYNSKLNTSLHGDKISEDGVCCACSSVISLYSIIKVGKRYYLQILLEEYKYAIKQNNNECN